MEKYNGFVNRETWAMCLWIANDQYLQEHISIMIEEILIDGDNHNAARALCSYMEELKADIMNDSDASSDAKNMVLDVGSFWRIDWYEVVDQFKQDSI